MFAKMLRHRVVSAMFFASFVFAAGGYAWMWFTMRSAGAGPFILHFDDIEGITAVGGLGTLNFMGIFGMLAVLANFAIALELEEKDGFLGKFLGAATLFFSYLLFMAFVAIISVN